MTPNFLTGMLLSAQQSKTIGRSCCRVHSSIVLFSSLLRPNCRSTHDTQNRPAHQGEAGAEVEEVAGPVRSQGHKVAIHHELAPSRHVDAPHGAHRHLGLVHKAVPRLAFASLGLWLLLLLAGEACRRKGAVLGGGLCKVGREPTWIHFDFVHLQTLTCSEETATLDRVSIAGLRLGHLQWQYSVQTFMRCPN